MLQANDPKYGEVGCVPRGRCGRPDCGQSMAGATWHQVGTGVELVALPQLRGRKGGGVPDLVPSHLGARQAKSCQEAGS